MTGDVNSAMGGLEAARGLLLETTNPYGNLVAVVEDDGETTYLYLHHAERREWGMRALWVANHTPSSDSPENATALGKPPQMATMSTRSPGGTSHFDAGDLEAVWTVEGDGVLLLNRGELLAALVPSADEACPGYSRDALGTTRWAWEMTDDARAMAGLLLADARATWRHWTGASADGAWRTVQESRLAHVESRLGKHAAYFKTTGDRFPPLGLARFDLEAVAGISIFATVGMSALPMPHIARELPDAAPFRRVEIAVACEGEPSWATNVLAWLARFPWTEYTWVGERHTILAPTAHATWFPPDQSAILLTSSPPADNGVAAPALDGLVDASGDPITYLWALPITMDERKVAQLSGSLTLLERLPSRGKSFVFRE